MALLARPADPGERRVGECIASLSLSLALTFSSHPDSIHQAWYSNSTASTQSLVIASHASLPSRFIRRSPIHA